MNNIINDIYTNKQSGISLVDKNKYPSISIESELEISKIVEMLQNKYNKSLLTKQEFAREIGVSTSTVDRLKRNAELKCKKIGGRIFVTLFEAAYFIVEVCDEY